jgi:hypothetical protein
MHHALEMIRWQVLETAEQQDGRAIHPYVYTPEFRYRLFPKSFDAVRIRNVECVRDCHSA